ncbi:hypothetical protein GGD83_000545 [Rhodoblastus sphagnicola]|nr:hypothetical protein [Rhodoblastus sphagnicola]
MKHRDLTAAHFRLGAHSTRRAFPQSSKAFVGGVSLGAPLSAAAVSPIFRIKRAMR